MALMVFLLYALAVLRNWSLPFGCSEKIEAEMGEGGVKLSPAFEHSHDTKALEFSVMSDLFLQMCCQY